MEERFNITEDDIRREQSAFITKVFGWMSFALLVTGFVALFVAQNEGLQQIIFGNMFVFWGLFIGELLLVGWLVTAVAKMRASTAIAVFIIYAAVNGLTLSFIFLLYTASSIATTFFITAGTFAIMSVFGYTTKKDLTSMGNLLYMALVGLVIATLVNIFLKSEMVYWITTYVGILIFVGLIAYDTQKIKEMNIIGNEGTEEDKKEAIMGALTLYLDFINLFLLLLRLLGRSRD
ncbi:MAG: Bax inhibitor-1/YccA family protein [Bacteroidota bacterium]